MSSRESSGGALPGLPLEPFVRDDLRSFVLVFSIAVCIAAKSGSRVGTVPQTIMRKSSSVTQAKMSNVAQVRSVRLASCARYCVLMPEQTEVRMLSPKTMLSWIRLRGLWASFQKTVAGRIARLASAKVLKAT